MKKLFFIAILVILLGGCGPDTQKVTVNDKKITVEKRSFSIACDPEKELGLAYFEGGFGDASDGYAGILVGEYYDKFCGDVK